MNYRTLLPKTLLLWPLLACAAAVLSLPMPARAWGQINVGDGQVQGSGQAAEVQRETAPFSRLRLDGPFELQASAGRTNSLRLQGDDNILPLLQTVVEGDTLVIRARPGTGFRTRQPLRVKLVFSTLAAAELEGSGDAVLAGLNGPSFALSLSGSGDVRLQQVDLGRLVVRLAGSGDISAEGRSQDTEFHLAGSGDIRAEHLLSLRTKVRVAGSGDARVHASESLDARVAGSGDVSYAGQPAKVSRAVAGSGEIRALR